MKVVLDTSAHTQNTLFDQPGLPSSDKAIQQFITTHHPFSGDVALTETTLWPPAQSGFLREALENDSDRSEGVDELDTLLRH